MLMNPETHVVPHLKLLMSQVNSSRSLLCNTCASDP